MVIIWIEDAGSVPRRLCCGVGSASVAGVSVRPWLHI